MSGSSFSASRGWIRTANSHWGRDPGMGFSRTWLVVTALIVSVCISRCGAQDRPCNAKDKEALLEFKAGFITSGLAWTTWDPDTNCCGWKGVFCSLSGRVHLLLFGEGGRQGTAERDPSYKGVVGATLGDLSELVYLDLGTILFNGPMPNIFDKLQKLEGLDFSLNNFSGSLPPSIGRARSLESLKLDGRSYQLSFPNVIPAEIPSSFCQLKNLRTLSLTNFKLKGKVPECLCELHQLKVLELNDNELEGGIPSCLVSGLRNLEKLVLSGNKLAGDIPAPVGRLTSLKSLDLHDNKLSGSIPKEIGKLVHLQSLILSHNFLSGPIPETIGDLAQLTVLELDFNSFTQIPPAIGKLAKIRVLSMRNNQLEGSLPPEIGNCGSEETSSGYVYLEISDNKLSGPIPDVFGNGHFNIIYGSNNQFTGVSPCHWPW
ncbi:hypothetical protein R1sor_004694 [Riccia sorocarpa]|uniref:Leucine-rich repeat-containing N-terminal plant-type domain-containing protein n=1 Tax=Riccia sorocarpa TaxID=122646 RepID=A0ABD3HI00_9MARC